MFRVYEFYWIEDHYKCASGGGCIFTNEEDAIASVHELNEKAKESFTIYEQIRNKVYIRYCKLTESMDEINLHKQRGVIDHKVEVYRNRLLKKYDKDMVKLVKEYFDYPGHHPTDYNYEEVEFIK